MFWSFAMGAETKSSPVIADGKVFIGSSDSNVYAMALADGKRLWKTPLDGEVEAPPLFVDATVFVGSTRGTLHALEAATGRPRWAFKTEDRILGSANWAPGPGGKGKRILVGSYDNRMYGVDAATGAKAWTYETRNYINGAPAADNHRTVFGGCDAILHLVATADGTEQAAVAVGAYVAASAALAGDRAFVGHYGGKLVCVDLVKRSIAWEYKGEEEGSAFFSSPAVGADRIVIGARDHRVHAVARADGRRLWTFQTRGEVDSSPVICGDKVVVGSSDGRLYAVRLSDGGQVWSREMGAPIGGSPAVANGVIVVVAQDGRVCAWGRGEGK
ncbi:MAG: PQQ-binding-like beta-propeller repeat protein [Planctomycetota bacterium]